jgi:hypothetical protein
MRSDNCLEGFKHGQGPNESVDSAPKAFHAHGLGVDLALLKTSTRQWILDHEFDIDLSIDLTQGRLKGFDTRIGVEHKLESCQRLVIVQLVM